MTAVEKLRKEEKIKALRRKCINLQRYAELENRELTAKEEALTKRMLETVIKIQTELSAQVRYSA